MARHDDPGEALARVLHEDFRQEHPGARGAVAVEWRYLTEDERAQRVRAAERTLNALAADGWRLTREPELTVERLAAVLQERGAVSHACSRCQRFGVVRRYGQAAAILAALERDDDAR